jgi:HK97 gp10 family phage protein
MSVFRGRETGTNWAAGGVTWKKGGVKMDLKWNQEALKILQALPLEIAEEVGRQIAAEAQARAPYRTGMLRAGIKMVSQKRGVYVRVRPRGGRIKPGKRAGKSWSAAAQKWRREVYPVFEEFGTQYMGARPFLRPAKALVERRIPQIARGKFRQVL